MATSSSPPPNSATPLRAAVQAWMPVRCNTQANGLYIMAYRNLTNDTHGAGGGASTTVRLGSWFICTMGAAICFITEGGIFGGVPCVWLGLWLLGMNCRYRAALKACLAGA